MATVLPAVTDNQVFCYDEQNRLVWAGSTGTPPSSCNETLTAGTLTAANYTASYSYDAMNRLTSAPTLGSYQYDTPGTPTHAASSTISGGSATYSASYDAVGDMTCRAPSSATTCVGTPTGQQLQYDAERRVSHWQSSPSSPTSSTDYLYDGSGQRVEQADTSGGTSTQVYYVFGGLEEVSSTSSTSTLTKYYSAGGLLIGENVGGTISYLASDGLGSVSEALSTSGTATAAQLFEPYGGVRYSSGTMPTAKGFTGQRADAVSGLDYYGARYYDPVLGQFASADTKQGPNRYAYVADDPETLTDPMENTYFCPSCSNGGRNGTPQRPGKRLIHCGAAGAGLADGADGGGWLQF